MLYVGVCCFTLMVPASHSLKDKRAVVRRLKDRVGARFKVVLREVGSQDLWQRTELAFSVLTAQRDEAQAAMTGVLGFVVAQGQGELALARQEVLAFGDDWYQAAVPMAAPTSAADDMSWLPAAWLAEAGQDGDGGGGDGGDGGEPVTGTAEDDDHGP